MERRSTPDTEEPFADAAAALVRATSSELDNCRFTLYLRNNIGEVGVRLPRRPSRLRRAAVRGAEGCGAGIDLKNRWFAGVAPADDDADDAAVSECVGHARPRPA